MVSAVVLAYNRCAEVLLTIDHLKKFAAELTFPLEIIVVDNASVDDTTQQVKEKHPDVVLITKAKNNGIAGWNEGFKVAKGKYVVVLDDDSHLHKGLEEAVEYMEENPSIGILAFSIKDPNWNGIYSIPPEEAWQDKQDIEGFIGCGAMLRKELIDKIGGYAEWIHVYTHEFDYSLRCLAAGYKVRFFEACEVMHRVSKLNRTNERLRIYGTRNELALVYKYFSKNKLKYLYRVWVNNFKYVKKDGIKAGYHIFLGGIKFIKMRKSIGKTPVSLELQEYFANNFWSTKPVFDKLKKKLISVFVQNQGPNN